MGFFSSLGKKISSVAHDYGKKIHNVVHKGTKFVADHAGAVEKVADTVGNVAGTLATGAAMIGLEPVAAGLAAGAAAAKGVSKVAGIAGTAARGALAAESAVKSGRDALDAARKGNIRGAISATESAIASGKDVMGARKDIQRRRK